MDERLARLASGSVRVPWFIMPTIHTIEETHLADLALLMPQWGDGVVCDPKVLGEQIARLRQGDVGEIFGAWMPDGTLVGYIQLREYVLVGVGNFAEIVALLVHDAYRGIGIATALLVYAEEWAITRNLNTMILSSQVHRVDAHSVYLKRGYNHFKHSYYFTKSLGSTRG